MIEQPDKPEGELEQKVNRLRRFSKGVVNGLRAIGRNKQALHALIVYNAAGAAAIKVSYPNPYFIAGIIMADSGLLLHTYVTPFLKKYYNKK